MSRMDEKDHRRQRTSFDYGYDPFGDRKTSTGNHYHRRCFSEKRPHSSLRDSDDLSYASVAKIRRIAPHPLFDGYQLVGDSLLLRFAEQVLFERCIYENGMRYLGLCVSGQTIEELRDRVENKFSPVGEKIILLIGTNNLLQNTPVEEMKTSVEKLLDVLDEKAKRIVILTLPPIPKLEERGTFWFKYNHYNYFLRSLSEKRKNVFVEDISCLYLDENRDCSIEYFERFYDKMEQRPDMIHLNRAGLLKLKTHLYKKKVLESDESDDESDNESDNESYTKSNESDNESNESKENWDDE